MACLGRVRRTKAVLLLAMSVPPQRRVMKSNYFYVYVLNGGVGLAKALCLHATSDRDRPGL